MRSRFIAVGLAVVMVASACGDTEPESTATTDSGPSTGTSLPSGQTTIDTPPQASPEELSAALATAGIVIVDEPGTAGEALELWSYQVANLVRELESGSGFLGTELDALAGAPGGLPFSYLLAGWLSSGVTPAAEEARALMGDQPWEEAPNLTYPTAVLIMFVADAVQAGAADPTGQPQAMLVALAQAGLCSTLAGWVNDVLSFIFDSLKVNADDDGFLGWLGAVWNAAVDLARDVITGLVEAVTAPIVAAISGALAVIGTLSMISSLLKPWELEVTPSRAQTRYAVGGEPDIEEQFLVSVDTGIDVEWPAQIVDCASVVGLELPDPSSATGSPIEWKPAGLPPHGSVGEQSGSIGEDNTATLDWVTGREESDEGAARVGKASVSVTVTSEQAEELKAMLELLISNQLPAPPFGTIVAGLFESLAGPVFDALAELVSVRGAGSASVVYHDEEEEEPAPPPSSGIDSCVVGTWVSTDWTLPGPAGLGLDGSGGAGAVMTVESDGSAMWDFNGMEPVVVVDDIIDVTTEHHTAGTATGTVLANGGTWQTEVDTSGMDGFSVDNIIGTIEQVGGPGLFVGVLDAMYTCSGGTLTLMTTDPVENVPVTVVFQAG